MRVDQPNKTPHAEALHRARLRKVVGRKHNHQPRGRALQKQLETPKKRQALENVRRKRFNAQVRAYWLGKRDTFPSPLF